jgi:murein DD-endopeptidase MepM/ murein hydrolase activator NlpD
MMFFRMVTFVLLSELLFSCKTTSRPLLPSSVQGNLYQVEVASGDTLNSISEEYDTTWRDIVALNKETLRGGLRVGQVLKILPGPNSPITQNGEQTITALEAQSNDHDGHDHDGELNGDDDIPYSPRKKDGLNGGSANEEITFIFPAPGRISSKFGKRGRKFHKGIDIAVNIGTPIRASAGGEVIFSGSRRGYGGTVVVDHGRYMTLYAHCSKMIARVGDTVKQGDYIARSGRTGNSRGAHLHFEIRDERNRPIDPLSLLQNKPIAQVFPDLMESLWASQKEQGNANFHTLAGI